MTHLAPLPERGTIESFLAVALFWAADRVVAEYEKAVLRVHEVPLPDALVLVDRGMSAQEFVDWMRDCAERAS